MDARALTSKPAKDYIEYGARERLAYYDKRDRKILKRINEGPAWLRFLNWLVPRR